MRIERLTFGCVHPALRLPGATVNVYLLEIGSARILIDSGPPGTGPALVRRLRRRKWQPDFLALTHAHFDHSGGAPSILSAFPNCQLLAHPEAIELVESGFVVVPKIIDPITPLRPMINWTMTRRCGPSAVVQGGFEALLDLGIEPLDTPGHAYPHTSFLLPNGSMVAGDALVVSPRGNAMRNGWGEDRADMERSLELIARRATHLVHPGHGPECVAESVARAVASGPARTWA